MKRESKDSSHCTIEQVVKKSVFNQALKNVHTDIKRLMIKEQSNNVVFNINTFNSSRALRLSQINYQLSNNKYNHNHIKREFCQSREPISSAKNINTSMDFRSRKIKDRNIVTENKQRNTLEKQPSQELTQTIEASNIVKFQSQKLGISQNPIIQSTKTISRYLFQMNVPQNKKQQEIKIRKLKIVPLFSESQKSTIGENITHQIKQTIPNFIQKCIESSTDNNNNNKKLNNHSYYKLEQDFIPPEIIPKTYQSKFCKKIKYSLKSKKIAEQKHSKNQINYTQTLIKPNIEVVKLQSKPNSDKNTKTNIYKIHQKAFQLLKRKKHRVNIVQENNDLCGWQLNDNIRDFY